MTVTDVGPIGPADLPGQQPRNATVAPGFLTVLDPGDAKIEPIGEQPEHDRTPRDVWLVG